MKAAERARLSRNKRVAPIVKLIDADLIRLAPLGVLPEVPKNVIGSLAERLEGVSKSTQTRKNIAEDESKATREHAAITVDEAVLGRAGDVLRLFGETGAYDKNRRDLPRVQAEANEYGGVLAELTVRLGLSDAVAVEAAQPTDSAQALIRDSLISECRDLTDSLERNTAALATEREALSELGHARAMHGGLANPQPLRDKFAALTPVLRNLPKRVEMELAIRAERRNLREAAGRLAPPVVDLDVLAGTVLPGLETIARVRKEFDDLEQQVRRNHDRLTAAAEAMATTKSKLRDFTSGRQVPSAEAIAAKREQRDTEWSHLRATLFH